MRTMEPRVRRLRPGDVLRVGSAGLRTRSARVFLSALGIAIGIAAMDSRGALPGGPRVPARTDRGTGDAMRSAVLGYSWPSGIACMAASSADAAEPSMPTSRAYRYASVSLSTPSSSATSRPARAPPTSSS